MKIETNTLNIGRKRDPEGYFVAIMPLDVYDKLKDIIDQLVSSSKVIIDRAGTAYILRSKSWNTIAKLANVARQRGVRVEERRA